MHCRILYLSMILVGGCGFNGEAAPLKTLFSDVTLSTLGEVPHLVSGNDIKIGTGAAWFDYDRDGDLDLYMTNRFGANRLWRNQGGGSFTEVAGAAGAADSTHDGSGVAVADFDNDGDLDLYLANTNADVLFRNQLVETGTAAFTDITATAFPGIVTTQRGTTASWGDYDKDGLVDLYVANHREVDGTGAGQQDRLFHNNGNGTFTDVSALLLGGDADGDGADDNLGGFGFIGGWTDYDKDGDLDIFLVNDCPFGPENTKLFRNDGGTAPLAWNFTEVGTSVGAGDCRNGMGLAWGDYDRDGWPDYFYTNVRSPLLLHNDGGRFSDVTAAAGLEQDIVPGGDWNRVTWGTVFLDYDLDGFVDLAVVGGALTAASIKYPDPNLLYHNDGNGISFTDVSVGSGFEDPGRGRTVVMGDYDQDGDPDLFLVNHGEKAFLFRNDYANTTGWHWIILNLQGAGPPLSNRDGIGAKIKVTTPDGSVQHWETRSGDSLGGGSDLAAYFGLKANTLVSAVEVTWPSGITQTVT
ncbi:MAG: CRTAC1 family protein, partial [Chthoniobacterales bacterium]